MVLLGIDIGGSQLRAGMVDERGAVLASRTIQTPGDLESFVSSLHAAIRWLVETTSLPAGAGVGCKGAIDPDSTVVQKLPGTLHYLQEQRISEIVGLPPQVPVFADHDARAALAGEIVWGAARDRRDVVMLNLGNTVGGAALIDGKLLRGAGGIGGHARSYYGGTGRRHLRLRQPRLPGDCVFSAGHRKRSPGRRPPRL